MSDGCSSAGVLGSTSADSLDQGNTRLAGLLTQLDLTGKKYNMALMCYFSLLVQIPGLIRFTDHVFRRMYSALPLELVLQLLLLVILHV